MTPNRFPVFYNPAMVVEKIMETPSTRKPREVVDQWKALYPVEMLDFVPLARENFCLAHDRVHVEGVFNLSIPNGMDNRDPEVAASLPWTAGSFHAAALHALEHGAACSPTSGFHHAGHDFSWGFCTFNGLAISALKLLAEGRAKKIGILDCDHHEGDGTQNIIDRLALADRVIHRTGKLHYIRKSAPFLRALPRLLADMEDCDILFYQAGADQHVDDPLGGFLSSDEMRLRDRIVFEFAKSHAIPIAWNLAGGYQESNADGVRSIQKVLDLHNATMEECLSADLLATPSC